MGARSVWSARDLSPLCYASRLVDASSIEWTMWIIMDGNGQIWTFMYNLHHPFSP